MKGMIFGAILLSISSCVPADAKEEIDYVNMVVGLEYTQACVDTGYLVPISDEGNFTIDFIYNATESRMYYNKLSLEEKQEVADKLWELSSQLSYQDGCKLFSKSLAEMGVGYVVSNSKM